MRLAAKMTLAAALFFGLAHSGSAHADSAVVGRIDVLELKQRGALIMTTETTPALVRLMKAGLAGRPTRSLSVSPAAGGSPVQLRDVTITGWTAAADSAVDVTLQYERAEF